MSWNYGDILDAIIPVLPEDAPALMHGEHIVTWPQFDRRTNALARNLLSAGAQADSKVAFYMRNRPEYMETLAACFRGRLVHVNVNYRYQHEELFYIFDNSDAEVIVFDSEFADNIEALRGRLPKVKIWVEVTSGEDPRCDFAAPYEDLIEGDGSPLEIERSPDDLLFLYTGGTTGMPKGVMWPADALRSAQLEALSELGPVPATLEDHVANVREEGGTVRQLPACPLMHGTGLFTAMGTMIAGGAVVTIPDQPRFSAEELWSTVETQRVTNIAIVGDAFAKPMLRALDENPDKYDLSSMETIVSSGVMFSREVKEGLLRHLPQVVLADSFGASESVGFATSYMTVEDEVQTAKFKIGDYCKVFAEDGREIEPGSGEPGFIARRGALPLGYYKDQKKTDEVYRIVNGERYSVPGDWCTVEKDGTLTLLGRGSVCINTGGEKVYPEEVEEVLKRHSAVHDALVVGLPDERWGQAVTAVVETTPGANASEMVLRDHVRESLAGYKVPKRVLFRNSLDRAPNGKPDYKATTEFAIKALGANQAAE